MRPTVQRRHVGPDLESDASAVRHGLRRQDLAPYAHGLTDRDIRAFLHEAYGSRVSPYQISTFFIARRVKMRGDAVGQSKAVYLALAILPDGRGNILGLSDDLHHRRACAEIAKILSSTPVNRRWSCAD